MDQYSSQRFPDLMILYFINDDLITDELELEVTLGDFSISIYYLIFDVLRDGNSTTDDLLLSLCSKIPNYLEIDSTTRLFNNLKNIYTVIKSTLNDNNCYDKSKLIYKYKNRLDDGLLIERIK